MILDFTILSKAEFSVKVLPLVIYPNSLNFFATPLGEQSPTLPIEDEFPELRVTTHSNVAIDLFGNCPDAQILKVCNDGYKSTVETVMTDEAKRNLLDDLGVKASDLLQANCAIWVEGPSDRIYIKKWLEIFNDGNK